MASPELGRAAWTLYTWHVTDSNACLASSSLAASTSLYWTLRLQTGRRRAQRERRCVCARARACVCVYAAANAGRQAHQLSPLMLPASR